MPDTIENTQIHSIADTMPNLPQTKRGIDRREALLAAADELFLQHGFDGVSLDSLVAHVGGSKASIYQYFGCKKGLLVALVQRRHECFFGENAMPTELGTSSVREVLMDTALKLYNAVIQPDKIAFMRLIVRESQRDPEIGRIAYELGPARGQSTMAKILTDADARGDIYCPHPFESTVMFGGFLQHIKWRILIGLPPLEENVSVDDFFEFFIDRFLAAHHPSHRPVH
ncbi:TetR/AcrR family transcriptional regulator [Aquirhabdus sp.]|uniref:TetR/AcrR family transcriptional regulator n=1 Tax=Aquirhabdus sp. TaxID=2824160 RepID=UPI00396C80A2